MNVLAEGQDDVSQNFARSGTDKFAGVRWSPSAHGSPVLDDVVAWIDGELWAEYDGGDHSIVVARVLDLGARSRPPSPALPPRHLRAAAPQRGLSGSVEADGDQRDVVPVVERTADRGVAERRGGRRPGARA